jgi:hypothetical protein
MSNKPEHIERGGEVHADTPDKWSDDDVARQEHGLPQHPKKELPFGKEVPGSNHDGYAEAEVE